MLVVGFVLCMWLILGSMTLSKGMLSVLIALELLEVTLYIMMMMLAVVLDVSFGGVCGIMLIVGAAAQAAVGLALLVMFSKHLKSVSLDVVTLIKG